MTCRYPKTRLNSDLTNLQLNPKPVVSYKLEKLWVHCFFTCVSMLQKTMKILAHPFFWQAVTRWVLCGLPFYLNLLRLWTSKIVQDMQLHCLNLWCQYFAVLLHHVSEHTSLASKQWTGTIFLNTVHHQVCYYKPNNHCLRSLLWHIHVVMQW